MGDRSTALKFKKRLHGLVREKDWEEVKNTLLLLCKESISVETLKLTKLGQSVGVLRKCQSDPEVAATARLLVEQWKQKMSKDNEVLDANDGM